MEAVSGFRGLREGPQLMAQEAKYRQVEAFIKGQIADGSLKIGSQIMTEEQLGRHFGFSRMTINRAISNLTTEGYIERIPGRGSFVSAAHVAKPADSLHSFSEDMRDIGLEPGSRLLKYEVIQAHETGNVAEKLNADPHDLLHHFVRLRTGNGKPIAISYNYVAANVIPAIDVARLDGSFYEFLDEQGIVREYRGSEFRATLPSEEQKRLLEADDIALFCSAHVTYTRRDGMLTPFEYTETYYNGEIYTYVARD